MTDPALERLFQSIANRSKPRERTPELRPGPQRKPKAPKNRKPATLCAHGLPIWQYYPNYCREHWLEYQRECYQLSVLYSRLRTISKINS